MDNRQWVMFAAVGFPLCMMMAAGIVKFSKGETTKTVAIAGFDENKVYSEADVLPLAQKDTVNIRVAFSKSAIYCAEGFSDPYQNAETPKTMSRVYGKLVNRVIREGQNLSPLEELDASVQKDVIAEFARMKANDPDADRSPEYAALGLINIGFESYNRCVYQNVPKFLAEVNKGRVG